MHQKNHARAPIARILMMIRQPSTDCQLHKAQIRPAFQGHNVPMILGSQCNIMHTVTWFKPRSPSRSDHLAPGTPGRQLNQTC